MPTDRDVRQIELVSDLSCGHSLAASLHHVGLTARELQLEPVDQRLLLRARAQLVDEGADARTWDDRVAPQRNLDGAARRLGSAKRLPVGGAVGAAWRANQEQRS